MFSRNNAIALPEAYHDGWNFSQFSSGALNITVLCVTG